jgi:hypothetical protein
MSLYLLLREDSCLWKNGSSLVLMGWGIVEGKNRLAQPARNARYFNILNQLVRMDTVGFV